MKNKHRIYSILNRNIRESSKYSYEEISKAFKKDYSETTIRERLLFSKFFKEYDPEDINSFLENFEISFRDIENIYKDIPEKTFPGIEKRWNKLLKQD